MKSLLVLILFSFVHFQSKAQELKELFTKSETQVHWLGIDFSHVKLIGDFKQFGEVIQTLQNYWFTVVKFPPKH